MKISHKSALSLVIAGLLATGTAFAAPGTQSVQAQQVQHQQKHGVTDYRYQPVRNDNDRYYRDDYRYDNYGNHGRNDFSRNPHYYRDFRQDVGRVIAIEARHGGYHHRNRDDGVEGALLGAIIGGLIGNQVGSGSGREAATVAGAIAGGVAGRNIDRNNDNERYRYDRDRGYDERGYYGRDRYDRGREYSWRAREPDAYAISVELRSGRVITVVQARQDGRFHIGERVRVIERGNRARIEEL